MAALVVWRRTRPGVVGGPPPSAAPVVSLSERPLAGAPPAQCAEASTLHLSGAVTVLAHTQLTDHTHRAALRLTEQFFKVVEVCATGNPTAPARSDSGKDPIHLTNADGCTGQFVDHRARHPKCH